MNNPVVIGNATLYLGDCLEILPTLAKVDCVITDPPYGIGMDGGNVGYKGFNDFEKLGWDTAPASQEAITAALGAAPSQVIWGGNYYALRPSRGWLVWDKGNGFKGRTYAEAELAWTSIDANVRVFSYDPLANGDYHGKAHPTMKPVRLMKWCIKQAGDPQSVIDPFMGSGSTGIACAEMNRTFIGIEIEPRYFEIACKRIEDSQRQARMLA